MWNKATPFAGKLRAQHSGQRDLRSDLRPTKMPCAKPGPIASSRPDAKARAFHLDCRLETAFGGMRRLLLYREGQ